MSEYETLGEFKEVFTFDEINSSIEGIITDYKVVITRFNKEHGIITIGDNSIYEVAGLKIYNLKKYIGKQVKITYTGNKYSKKYYKEFKVFKVEVLKENKNLQEAGFKL